MEKQYIGFEIASMKYCIDIMDVKEVRRENRFTKMPDMPDFIEGILNLRGIVIPVISLKKKLKITSSSNSAANESEELTEPPPQVLESMIEEINKSEEPDLMKTKLKTIESIKLIIVNIEGVLIGFLVDKLDHVFSVDDSAIQSAEGVTTQLDRSLIEGVAKADDDLFIILNVKRLIDVEEKKYLSKEIIE